MTDPDPPPARAAATDPAEPVTVADIAAFTARLARLRPPALGGDPAEYAALLAHKAKLLARIADQHARTDPPHAGEAREIAERAQRAVTTRHAADAHDTTNVKDLRSPSFPGWGISLSNTGEFRRASSPQPETVATGTHADQPLADQTATPGQLGETPPSTARTTLSLTRVPQLNGAPGHADRHRRSSPTCRHCEKPRNPKPCGVPECCTCH